MSLDAGDYVMTVEQAGAAVDGNVTVALFDSDYKAPHPSYDPDDPGSGKQITGWGPRSFAVEKDPDPSPLVLQRTVHIDEAGMYGVQFKCYRARFLISLKKIL